MFGKPFGTSTTTSAFGTGSSLFGSSAAKPTVGFGSPSTAQSGSLFGQKPLFGASTQPTSLFGSAQPTATTSSSLFGQSKPLFGSATTSQPNAFGGTTSIFGSGQTSAQSGSLFSSSFGSTAPTGTTIKFEPPTASDTMLRNGTNQTINTKHMCITSMKQYEGKSLEELRCEDYIANRRGATVGSLSFGQSQPTTSTSLFGASTTTQSSLFGSQNKPLFGGTSTFGTTTTTATPSLFGSTTSTGTSLFGASKPATGGLFGSTQTSTASPFGQTQQSGGLFGSKPATLLQSSLHLDVIFTPNKLLDFLFFDPFVCLTGTAPFGSTATSTSLFGSSAAKPTTSLFGAPAAQTGFGMAPAATNVVAAQAAPIVLGADVSQTLIQNTLKPSLLRRMSKDTSTSIFTDRNGEGEGKCEDPKQKTRQIDLSRLHKSLQESRQRKSSASSGTPAPGSAGDSRDRDGAGVQPHSPTTYNVSENGDGAPPRPVLSPETENAHLKRRAELRTEQPPRLDLNIELSPSSSYGTTTAISGLKSSGHHNGIGSTNRSRSLEFTPACWIANRNAESVEQFPPSLLRRMSKDTSTSIFTDRNGEGEGKCEDPKQKTRQIDLSRLHKSLQESRQRKSSASSGTPAPGSAGDSRDRDGAGVQPHSPTTYNVSENGDGAPPRPVLSPETENAHLKRRAELRTEQPPRLDLNIELSPSSSLPAQSAQSSLSERSVLGKSSLENVREEVADKPHPAGIRLRRLDYVCEPSLEQLALMAERDGGVCHLEKGFTVRRFAYGSVFWPGPFDLSNVDIDKVVHFRQNEVIIYPDDLDKPPIGEQLNRFAEISLERVWPRDKVTKESIMDPIRLEQMHFRERLERVSARMGANFKDYRPETGTWVFTVSHFTKYGLPDESDDDEMPSAEELRVAMGESRLQNAVQRDRLRLSAQQVPEVFPAAPDESATQRRDLRQTSQLLNDEMSSAEELRVAMGESRLQNAVQRDRLRLSAQQVPEVFPAAPDESATQRRDVVHFRQNEVIIYPDDLDKPPIGEQLNRFAEISLERVWPRDKVTKESIMDPIRLEQMHFRERLERVSARMGANFKDYRPETGTWVFTVSHFTKYGLPDESDDDEMPSAEELRVAMGESRLQNAVQRDRLRLSAQQVPEVFPAAPDESATQRRDMIDSSVRVFKDVSQMPTPIFNRALGGLCAEEMKTVITPKATILDFDQTIDSIVFTPAKGIRERKHKIEPTDGLIALGIYALVENRVMGVVKGIAISYVLELVGEGAEKEEEEWDSGIMRKTYSGASAQLDELMEDSFTFERGKERAERKTRRMHLKAIEPKNDLTFVVSLSESFVTKMRAKRGTIIDEALFNLRRTRVGWATNGLLANSGLPASFDVHLLKLDYPDELPRDYIVDMFEHNIRLSSRMAERQFMDKSVEMGVVERITPSRDYAQMVDSFIATSKQSKMPREESVWKLCSALFTHPSLLIASSDYTRGVVQRDCVGDWLREAIAAKHLKLPPPGKKRILFHVLAGNLSEAVEEAISANRPLLAVALSSFLATDRTPYKQQAWLAVEFWVQSQATDFMEEDLLKIYMVMAGMMQVDLKSRRVFVCEGLNWMRALGVFVWYYNPYHAPLKEVISAFEEDLEARNCRDSLGNSVFYELIKLASERSHPLELILEPSAFDNQPLDYHLSWHLWCVLRSIGYEHMDEFMERCLHIRYAEQLAGMGLVHLAIFVLMHISDLNARQNAVTEMIDRVAPEADEALYKKVESVCALPPETIAHSKYMRAKLEGDEEAMCLHALDAAMYQEAHSLFYDSVAPSAVTRDDDELLGRLFEKFEAESDKISCWGPRGQIYTDYYHLKEGIHEITDECHVESLLELAHSLEPRICAMSAKTPLQSLSMSVMSRLVYEVIARFESKQLVDMPFSMEEALQATCNISAAAIPRGGYDFSI
ncbi:Nuclear pore complex protein Nup98-Nup96 [Toxocara canis]|uniref:Nuclear pore complex protein Nup98-Nup96 n=1 Tax=Toxocara canis TaxID=6265 RepID=A0A0B2VZT8_TOXCA|nr:Nuclear pore complex protein Nup98-Nup96 [Toxocara canis]